MSLTSVRIVALSDTHSRHQGLRVPDGDILIHAGDATMMGTVPEVAAFNQWLGRLPHKRKILCAGNHDWLFERQPALARSMITNAMYAQDELIETMGLRFYLSPWQPRFFDWAFNLDRGEALRRKWDMIPDDIDVLVTHGPPLGILDLTPRGEHAGCADLLTAVRRVRPKLHIFGHIHHSYGAVTEGGTQFMNACICTENYRPDNAPLVADLKVGT